LSELKNQFELISLPFNSSPLNKNQYLISNSKKKPLSADDALKYILAGNQSGLSYNFEKYDMETGDSKGVEKQFYAFYPVYRIEVKELLMLIALRTSFNTQSYLLSLCNLANGKISEPIEINKLDAEDEYKLLQSSYLDKSLQLRIFNYQVNPDYLRNIKTEQNKSIITEMIYEIDDTIKLISKKSRKSLCSVSDFYEKNKKCTDDDPMMGLPID
jgi:hypothetical protein